jgi:hypothetical protein
MSRSLRRLAIGLALAGTAAAVTPVGATHEDDPNVHACAGDTTSEQAARADPALLSPGYTYRVLLDCSEEHGIPPLGPP